jgi:RHS repeat-associated protein
LSNAVRYTYRPDDAVTDIVDQLGGVRHFALDPVGRAVGVTGRGRTETYAYDPTDNLVYASSLAGETGPATNSARTHSGTLLRSAGNTRYDYDRQGRVTARHTRTLSGQHKVWRYTWDSDDRLTTIATPDGATWRYTYDPLGRRVSKHRHAPDGTVTERTEFTWDGVVLAEQARDDGHTTTWDYQPDSHTPLTQAERSPHPGTARDAPQESIDRQFYAIVTDLVGAPSELVDPNGALVWHQPTTLWGESVAPGIRRTDCPLRFPGQYHDPETGHNYNYHRYYDPATGGYLSEDPLGLTGGPNPSRYVSNPISWMDPFGLAPKACSQARRLYGLARAWLNNRSQTRRLGGTSPEPNATVRDLLDLTPGNPQRPHKLPGASARPDSALLNSVFNPSDGQFIATHPSYPNTILQGNHRAYQLLERARDPNNANIIWDTPIYSNRGRR